MGLHFDSPPHDGRAGLSGAWWAGGGCPARGQADAAKQQTVAVRPERHLQQALLACVGWAVLGSASDREALAAEGAGAFFLLGSLLILVSALT